MAVARCPAAITLTEFQLCPQVSVFGWPSTDLRRWPSRRGARMGTGQGGDVAVDLRASLYAPD